MDYRIVTMRVLALERADEGFLFFRTGLRSKTARVSLADMVSPELLERIKQNTFMWGCFSTALALVLVAAGTMMRDTRVLLYVAWPFAVLAILEFSRIIIKDVRYLSIITLLSIVVCFALICKSYEWLAPLEPRVEHSKKDHELQMARRWIALSRDILIELSDEPQPHTPSITKRYQ
jgi:hypothetical protein